MQFRTCVLQISLSLQSRRKFGERLLSIFLVKIVTATFYFNASGKLRRERNLYQGGERLSKIMKGVGVRSDYFAFPSFHPPTAASISESNMAG